MLTPNEPVIDLDEACRLLSMAHRRPEMIAAFHYTEQAAGRTQDSETAYRERFAALSRPTSA